MRRAGCLSTTRAPEPVLAHAVCFHLPFTRAGVCPSCISYRRLHNGEVPLRYGKLAETYDPLGDRNLPRVFVLKLL